MTPKAEQIAQALLARGHDMSVHAFDTLSSTNAWLAQSNLSTGLCITDHQIDGRGRRGRQWQSLPGNITFSIKQTLPVRMQDITQLPLVTGIACAEALRDSVGLDVGVKWPNDLIVNGAKLGGLLHETHATAAGPQVIGGIGVNLVRDAEVEGLSLGGTTLAHHGVPAAARDDLLIALAGAVLDAWQRWSEHGWSEFSARWQRVDVLDGVPVRVFHGLPDAGDDTGFEATASGVDPSGALRVRNSEGQWVLVQAGEVSVRPTPRS